MATVEQITIDDRPYARWKAELRAKPSNWIVRSALPRQTRLFVPEILAAAEESIYARERAAVLAYKWLREETAAETIEAGELVVKCSRCGEVRGFGSEHCNGPGCADPVNATIAEDLEAGARLAIAETRR